MSFEMPSGNGGAADAPLELLAEARAIFTQRDLAAKLKVTPRTISRWENEQTACPALAAAALRDIIRGTKRQFSGIEAFTFIDLFAGIGGMRMAFEQVGGRCVFASELDHWAQKTYLANCRADGELLADD